MAMYRLVLCLVFVASTLAAPRPATAAVTDFYDTVDFVEITARDATQPTTPASLVLRGIPAGGNAPVTRTYRFQDARATGDGLEMALHCNRLAVLAMSKPGKFQFAIHATGTPTCRLTLVAP